MKPDVAKALKNLEANGPGTAVRTVPDADGGVYVIVDGVDIGPNFKPRRAWLGFHIVWSCADADVYPHFLDPQVKYVGNGPTPNNHEDGPLPAAMMRGQTMPGFNCPAIQVSRRSNRRNGETDSPLQKMLRVIEFLRTR